MLALTIHIVAGALALAAGGVALVALKGTRLHRRSGTLFTGAMLLMGSTGAGLAAIDHYSLAGELLAPKRISIVAGGLSVYLAVTAWLTVRRRPAPALLHLATTAVGLVIGVAGIRYGLLGLQSPDGLLDGLPPQMAFLFGGIALLAMAGDARLLLVPETGASYRIARHLWRMCCALAIAAAAFFLGQMKVFPPSLRHPGLLALPVLLSLLSMTVWLLRMAWASWRSRCREPRQAH